MIILNLDLAFEGAKNFHPPDLSGFFATKRDEIETKVLKDPCNLSNEFHPHRRDYERIKPKKKANAHKKQPSMLPSALQVTCN